MGDLKLNGATSGTITLTPTAVAGTNTITLPASTGTVALTASPTFSGTLTATTITSPSATALTLQYGGTTGATLDTSGNLLVGTTSAGQSNTQGFAFNAGSGSYLSVGHASGTAGGQPYLSFSYNGSAIGSVTQNGTTAVAFNTSSDYRLKENIARMTTGLATVSALRPVTYDWISDKSRGEGFIAHELAEIVPLAVSGEKDAVGEDGTIRPQGVDYSKIVVHLVAAVQELSAKNDALEARLAALEAK